MSSTETGEKETRKRGLTSVTLGWIAERIRKAESIKQKLANGTYDVKAEDVAKSMLNKEN